MTTQEAVAGLRESLSTPLDRNDLGRLARMHSLGQSLMETEAPSEGQPGIPSLVLLAKHVVDLLERIILDEAADPDGGIALVPDAVDAIERLAQGEEVDPANLIARTTAAIEGGASPTAAATAPVETPASAPVASAPPADAAPQAAQPAATPEPAEAETPQADAPPPAPPAAEPVETSCASPEAGNQDAAPAPEPAPTTASDAPAAPEPQAEEEYVSEPLIIDMEEKEHLEGFLDEAAEHMDAIEAGLLDLENDPTDTNRVNELFRPFHTIKGIAGFLNLRDINRLTHEIETILDLGRKNELKLTTVTVDLIFSGVDLLKAQLDAIRQYMAAPTGEPCPQPVISQMIQKLQRVQKNTGEPEPSASPRLGQILVQDGIASEDEIREALDRQAVDDGPKPKLGEMLVKQGVASEADVEQALLKQRTGSPVVDTSIRVDTRKLDVLVDTVGELVIAQSMVGLSQIVQEDEKLSRNVTQVSKIVRDLQETAMAMRMVPIGHTFQKMRRLVRDVSRKAGKQVELVINGEETELDKNVIQQISDPLVHMVRNAVDHGVESPEKRQEAGKSPTGTVQLNAFHQGDSIVVEIRDDGKGLDPQKLIAKGIERGLVSPDEQLSDSQAFALILQAGFSTAEQITDISGRGVGMDVVKRNIEQLRGKIEISSEKGRGSVFSIRLPLTLAIIDGMLVRVGAERMIIPTILIEQSLRPEPRQITSVQRRGAMLQVRGELCPLIQLGNLFDFTPPIDPCDNLVVIVQCEGRKVALVVDELIGQQQVVIKTLGERFKQVQGVSGAAILGDGRVGIILEPTGLLGLHNSRGCATYSPGQASMADAFSFEMPAETMEDEGIEDVAESVAAGGDTETDNPNESGAMSPTESVSAPV